METELELQAPAFVPAHSFNLIITYQWNKNDEYFTLFVLKTPI